jgi:hypothetical protein
MFLFWLFAFIKARKNPYNRWWVLTAAVVTLIAYMIPHSLLGSEIDFTQEGMNYAFQVMNSKAVCSQGGFF